MAAAAAEEDTELRDLLVQTLESSGVLNKIKVGEEEPPASGESWPALAALRGPAKCGRTEASRASSPLTPACRRCSRLEGSLGVAAWWRRLLCPWCSPAARGGAGARARGLTVARRCPAAAGIRDPPGGQSRGSSAPAVRVRSRVPCGRKSSLAAAKLAGSDGQQRGAGVGEINPRFNMESPY